METMGRGGEGRVSALAEMSMAVARETFGQFLSRLRGRERPTDVARRVGFRISPRYITTLEGDYRGDVNRLFWDLWQRAGYPIPPGAAELTPETRQLVAGYLAASREQREMIRRILAEALERAGRDEAPPA